MKKDYDLIVIGSGASGIMCAIVAAQNKKDVLLLEKLPKIASKLKASGGGRCNLTNTLEHEDFMDSFGRNGRFMQDALKNLSNKKLIEFFSKISVDTHAPDGFRVFPTSHSSSTIIDAFMSEINKLSIKLLCNQKVEEILQKDLKITGVKTQTESFYAKNVVLATGGLGYPTLGSEGDGYEMAKKLGHTITKLYPAMIPLHTKESWVKNCTSQTIGKAHIYIDLKKYKKLHAVGDLIFTNNGIRGPLILDFAREITPLLETHKEVPIILNLTKGMNEEEIQQHLKKEFQTNPHANMLEHINTLLPDTLSYQFCKLTDIDPHAKAKDIKGNKKANLFKLLAKTPLTITGHNGFKTAMITRGGISLKEIDPKTMQSRIVKGLYLCGEVVDIDGPCGGYNLQWCFSSGFTAAVAIRKHK
jgi:predicted Rossmann fold flavoprotein